MDEPRGTHPTMMTVGTALLSLMDAESSRIKASP
jgi:hypothetical protein